MKKKQGKSMYNMWQNTGFMLRNAWPPYKSVIFLCIALALATAGKTVAELLIAPVILNKIETAVPLMELVVTIVLFTGILALLSGLAGYIDENRLFGRIQIRINFVIQIANKLAQTSYTNLMDETFLDHKNKASDICNDNSKSTEHIWTTWTEILINFVCFIVYLAILSGLNPVLAVVAIVTTTVGYFANKRLNRWDYCHKDEESGYIKRMNYVRSIATNRDYAKDIRIFRQKQWLDDVWQDTMRLYQAFLLRRQKNYIWVNVVNLLMELLRNGIAYAYLIWLALHQGMSASEFLLYFNTASGFSEWIAGILDKFTVLHKESLEISALREFLDWPEPFKLEGGKPLEVKAGREYEIRLENVSYRYPKAKTDTISHMNLTIHKGEKLAVVGLNGAGKTTLVRMVCGLVEPTQGKVLLNGTDIREYNRKDYYTLFSAVFQDFSILEATVAENVAQQVEGIDEEKVKACLSSAGLLKKVTGLPEGIYTHIGRKVFENGIELSGGELQRLMLARALYKDGAVLILDEPTAALDPLAENDIYMKYSQMTEGKTSLFISHRLASTRFCDRILYIENGKIVQEGTHEQLLAKDGGYARLFEVQSRYYRETPLRSAANERGCGSGMEKAENSNACSSGMEGEGRGNYG